MTDPYLFPRRSIEVVRIIDGDIATTELQEFLVKMIDGCEHIKAYSAWRLVQINEDGNKSITIKLESLPKIWEGVDAYKFVE